MTASTVKGYPRVWSLAVIVMVSVIFREESTFCVVAVNSGIIPQTFFDYFQQQQRQRTDPTILAPTTFPPTQPFIPQAFQPSAPPPPTAEPILPAEQPATSTFAPDLPLGDPYIPSQEPYRPQPQPPPPPQPKPPPPRPPPLSRPPPPPPPSPPQSAATPVIPAPRQTPSTQQLLQFQDVIRRQQQQLQRLKHEIAEQQRFLQQAPKPPPLPQLPKPAPSFPAPNYQFKPPPQQPPPPPRRLPPPPVPTTRGGVIDFVPAEHKAVAPRPPPPPRISPTRYRVTGSMPRDWIARQVSPNGRPHPHYHPLPSPPQAHPPPPQAWHRPNLASGANPVTLLPRLNVNDLTVKKFNPFSHMPLPRRFQSQAMSMGRKMCITQFYESHGCIDPVKYLPPGTTSQGLMMGCSHQASQQLCDAAGSRVPGGIRGRSKGLALAMMTRSPSSRALLEKCLSPNLVTNAIAKMMKGGGGGMNPAAMMMMMGGGEGGGGMAALAMMNLLNKQNGGVSTSSTSLPEGAARPSSSGGGGRGGGEAAGGGGEECTSVLPLLMLKGVEGGMLSPEMASTVMNMRKQLLPYTCQDIHYGVFFRMCCPGKVHRPNMMEMMTHCGG